MTGYAELGAMTNFSFLEGASHASQLVEQARSLGLEAIGIADRNTLAGVVRAHKAALEHGLRLLIGCRLEFVDGTELIVFPRDRAAYGRLCRLLSLGKSEIVPDDRKLLRLVSPPPPRIAKGTTTITFDQARALGTGLIALIPAPNQVDAEFAARVAEWGRSWPDDIYLAAAPLWQGDDHNRLSRLARVAVQARVPMVAVNAVRYHHPDQRMLQDVLTCVRHGTTIDTAGHLLEANAERYLKPPEEMARLFKGHEAALAATLDIVAACTFSLAELRYEYPDEPVPPGMTPGRYLIQLIFKGVRYHWPEGLPHDVRKTLRKELHMIRELDYAPYFITVHDIVAWAREQPEPILCQGRGSAANSIVCYCLHITAVDPSQQDVLMERFISEDRSEPPDIDVDFEHERREEVMQYVYRRYGRDRAAIVATVIHYRPRSAMRDVGKVLGLTEDVTARLASTIWGSFGREIEDKHIDRTGISRENPRVALAIKLARQLLNYPRHLSQHVGGFVLTKGPLIDTVPVGNGAMADRTFIEWDKDDIDTLGMMKIDVLALGMLSALRRGLDMVRDEYGVAGKGGKRLTLTELPRARKRVYDMLQKADSLGVFQVESRAQMAMLPRLKPAEFYDLVVQVAIVRPGPIQGDMVHPYLRNRVAKRQAEQQGKPFRIAFPSPGPEHGPPNELEKILGRTLGVPLFQEQAMRLAMVAAKFTGGEANRLRQAMATFRSQGDIGLLERRMIDGMVARGYPIEFAENCFGQIKGFGEYGFPESHAASFANLVYASAWMKCDWPDVFAAALLNSQPMGFYAPAQIVRDAREHGIEVRPIDVADSHWDCTLERRGQRRRRALRLGIRLISGFRRTWAEEIVAARADGPFASFDDLRRRARLPQQALDKLAGADALGSLELSRRQAMWSAIGSPKAAAAPLFDYAGLDESDGAPPAALPRLSDAEEVVGDYRAIRLSLKGHPLEFMRDRLTAAGVIPARALATVRDGRGVSVAGVVLVRQRPGTAKGVVFLTIEDETGVTNVVVWQSIFEAQRATAMGARMLVVHGRVQRSSVADGSVTHLVATRLDDWTPALGDLEMRSNDEVGMSVHRSRHPRDVKIMPGSRDFH
ncbi:error-prone DNA polymerase [Glacieibacterium sp.]|uniref:error-prone DNA polymerase n=1 Tax=Glacieibacterium sp. TaxID=2860237 RepID=UPI003B004889